MARKDITGQKFGRLIAIKPNRLQGKNTKWLCKCECGNEITTNISSLTRGKTKSCGCLRKEVTSAQFTKHGGRKEKLYAVYSTMKQRCNNKNTEHYADYGGRGISVCEEWLKDYLIFRKWALSNGYQEGKSIDRIDSNGNYEPSNCRWVTNYIQANNKRNNESFEYEGETHTLYQRIMVHKWDIERAMTQKQRGA